jgi:hypothetical protein
MGAITDLWKSERGLVAILLILGATVLTALGKMPVPDWREYTLYIFGTYALAKTVTGTVQIVKSKSEPTPATTPPTETTDAG